MSSSTIQSELAAQREEVSRLRQDQTSSAPQTPTAAAGSEKSRYVPAGVSTQQTELDALREEVVRLRGRQFRHGQSPLDEAPPQYEPSNR